jgi:hypothetical protein
LDKLQDYKGGAPVIRSSVILDIPTATEVKAVTITAVELGNLSTTHSQADRNTFHFPQCILRIFRSLEIFNI